MATPTWTFERPGRMGGAKGEAFVNTLHGTGMSPAGVLAREAIQNSADASEGNKVKVIFRRAALTGPSKHDFVDELQLKTEFAGRRSALELQFGNCLDHIDDSQVPLDLLYIEDFRTFGLFGDPHDDESHFFRLLLSLGDSQKARAEGETGGSYGYGKSVYSANSAIRTIVAYSVFDPSRDPRGHFARLMACSYFNGHTHEGQRYTGRGWFGLSVPGSETDVDPIEDDAAQALAERLGFHPRTQSDTGTSILIVDCGVTLDDLQRSVELWWWPRIQDDRLDVDLIGDDVVLHPRPMRKERADLKPFLQCYDIVTGRAPEGAQGAKRGDLNRLEGVALGSYCFKALDPQPTEETPEEVGDDAPRNSVALIRRPGMVVEYMQVSSLDLPSIGVFLADGDVDRALKISEPPSHDKWDSRSSRLENFPDQYRKQVKAIITRLERSFRSFAREAVPPVPPGGIRLGLLERLLGEAFRQPATGGSPSGSKADPISIRFVAPPRRRLEGEGAVTTGGIQLSLGAEAKIDTLDVEVLIQNLLVLDRGPSRQQASPVAAWIPNDARSDSTSRTSPVRLTLNKGERPTIEFESDPFQPDWTTRIQVMTRVVGRDGA